MHKRDNLAGFTITDNFLAGKQTEIGLFSGTLIVLCLLNDSGTGKMEEPAFSERIYQTISQKVSERTLKSARKTKAKYEPRLNRLRTFLKSADHASRHKAETQLKQCELALNSSLHRVENDSLNYLTKLGLRSTTSRELPSEELQRRPGTTGGRVTLLERPGSRSWTHLASGGKMKTLLGETIVDRPEANWDAFVGYQGPPYPARLTLADLTAQGTRDTHSYLVRDQYKEYGTNTHPTCRKELPRHAKKATTAQALLYLKLREDQYSKGEAIKHSSNITFKTDSGLHQLKGTKDPFMFNGLHVRVPVSDPESRFKPVEEIDEHKDFDMLSQAYEQFQRKYTVSNGEYEPNVIFFDSKHHTRFKPDIPPASLQTQRWTAQSRQRLAIPKGQANRPKQGKRREILVDVQAQEMEKRPSPVPRPQSIVPPIAILSQSPVEKPSLNDFPSGELTVSPTIYESIEADSPLKVPADCILKVEEAKYGVVSFRAIVPKPEIKGITASKSQRSVVLKSRAEENDGKLTSESSKY